MKNTVQTDIAIVGGGIAGLWLLNLLRKRGFSAILLESETLGAGQTGKSQGIIHGGMKYALQGKLTDAAKAIADMPSLWKQCLAGTGEIDLSRVSLLSDKQYLWSTASLGSKLAGLVAGVTLKSETHTLKKEEYPAIFQHPQFNGSITALDEIIIDVFALLRELSKPYLDVIFKVNPEFDELGNILSCKNHNIKIKAQKIIFTAGSGNAALAKNVKIQRRPLHMVVVKHHHDLPIYAHCLGLNSVPRITITTHRAHDGKAVWYLGGHIAEEGVKLTVEEQIHIAKNELQALFPWIGFSNAQFATFFIDRAEAWQSNGARPDSFYLQEDKNWIVAWPTKLALAPLLAHGIIACLEKTNIKPHDYDFAEFQHLPKPAIATPIWDELLT